MHHASIRTSDIYRAIAFYEQLGFQVCERFTAGITLACWMEGLNGRIELLQVPQPRPAADAFGDEHYTGYYHLSFDLTDAVADLPAWLASLRDQFDQAAQTSEQVKPLKVLLEPMQQIIGDCVYEVVFLADADGLPLEFLRQMKRLQDV
ncbi:MAG: VOC family protein [Oscillatoriophycideae cyanobacterium NC_groundwater_1537_Pr4_S-0.65um_50_18]|nr:VOC family protein [Oscillatoriophycideae cyanobacterium NC_groundwater_1537_Pr4_S-0.65um_50_18]